MTLLSLMVMLLLPLTQTSTSPPPQSPLQGPLVLRGALELPIEVCTPGIEQVTMTELPLQRCYHVPQTYQQTFVQLETNLVSRGYSEIYHATERDLIMSRWQKVKAPEQQVILIVTTTKEPLAGSLLVFVDPRVLQKTTSNSAKTEPPETWTERLEAVLEQGHHDGNAQTFPLRQDKRVSLPSGAVRLPAETCKEALQQMTQIESRLFSCYHFPQTFTQVRRELATELAALGYQEGMVHEDVGFNLTNWWKTEITEPTLGTVNAFSETSGGSIFFELDYTETQ